MGRSAGSELLVILFSFLLCGGLLYIALMVIEGDGITANAVRESVVASVQSYPAVYLTVLVGAALLLSSFTMRNSYRSF